ncbi:MAG TPA: biopolymer transporter ExbD [Gemmataceae bacterium]|nr:biopolymer transporter ExbD [Gemmataceae bacterium]
MADNRRLLDIWIVETNTAYRSVPFETVANWLQQGRLLADDCVRPAGTNDWFKISSIRALAPYLPKPEPEGIDDKAEALEPVEAEFTWRRSGEGEEDDPDMIPLIDIALVLLIFFMMTAAVQSGMFAPIDTPPAEHQLTSIREGTFFVAIDKDKESGNVRYALGKDDKEMEQPGPAMTHVTARLKKELEKVKEKVSISLRADRQLPIEVIKAATLELQALESQINMGREPSERVKFHISGEVRAPSN